MKEKVLRRKEIRRVLSAVLCLVMCLSLMPTTVFAAEYINKVNITDISDPVAGERVGDNLDRITTEDSSYVIANKRWWCNTSGHIKQMSSDDVFAEGLEYSLQVYVEPSNSAFYMNEDTVLVFNSGNYATDYYSLLGDTSLIGTTVSKTASPAPKYTVTFNANGHGTAPATQTVVKGSMAAKPTDLIASGYTFSGWYTKPDGTKKYDFSSPVNENITLYAYWRENIDTINILGVEAPVADKEVWLFKGLYTEDERCRLAEYSWMEYNTEHFLGESECFEYGHEYYLSCWIYAKAGFIITENTKFLFNDGDVSVDYVNLNDGDVIVLTECFTADVEHNHDFSKYVSNGNGTHKVVCADCGAVQEGHDKDACSGGTATCTAKAKCSKCKAEYGSLKAHTNTTTTTKATLTANGKKVTKCSVCGKSTTTTIYYPKTFTLSKTSCEYTGSQIKPTITITDSNGKTVAATNYTVAYGTNKAVGKGTVKVTFKGDYSGTKTVEFNITPKKTTIGTPAIASDGITVKWTANTSGTGYYIYRSVNGADYTKVKTITSNATVSWKDTGATTNGAKYQYKIYSYKTVDGTTYKSPVSSVKTIYFLTKPTVSSAALASDGITVKWAKNSKATGYYIYRSVNGADYTKVKTITSNATVSWKDTGAKTNGTKYQYKIYAYKTVSDTTYKSVVSAVKTTYFVSRPTISSLTAGTKAFTVKWGKNSKATGYQIQYSTTSDFSSGNKTVTVTSASTVSKTVSSLTAKKKYYVRIRTYKTVSGTKYYSAWSASKAITTK